MTVDYTRMPQGAPPQPPPPEGWWSRNWKWVVLLGCLLPVLLCGGGVGTVVFIAFKAMKSSEIYVTTLTRASNHPEVKARLGEPVIARWWLTGSVNTDNGNGHADIRIPISGPSGKGTVHAVANKSGGRDWVYETLEFEIGNETINLMESNSSPPESPDTTSRGD